MPITHMPKQPYCYYSSLLLIPHPCTCEAISQVAHFLLAMASITMTAPFIGGAMSTGNRLPVNRRLAVVVRAAGIEGVEQVEVNKDQVKNSRRDMMFTAAAAAVCSAAFACGAAMANEPKRGTPEAKKKYAPICVTMPTASICHK